MDIKLEFVQKILSNQDFLKYDEILTEMIKTVKNQESIKIYDKTNNCVAVLKTYEEMDTFHKRLIQVHGIYGYF